jgi:malonyl-CoA O-methyltransferase
VIVRQPQTVLDWWPASSASAAVLQAAYPKARRIGVTPDGTAAPAPAPWWSPRRWGGAATPIVPASQVTAGAGDLLWANMTLHWCADPLAEMRRWFDVLAVDGFLMFSTFGPGTLEDLRALYGAQGWGPPHADFVDMHDLGDMLVQAGFADPVMDQETITLNWPDAGALLAELRGLGANANAARFAGLRTARWHQALAKALQPVPAHRPSLRFEVVYGHAFRPPARVPVSTETQVSLKDMRSILRGLREG